MIARIHTTVQPVRRLIHNLLVRIGKHHPQALMYPLLVACKSQSSFRRAAAMSVVDAVRQHSATLVEQAQLVSLPLELAVERQCFSLSPDSCKAHSGLMLTSCRECCGRWWGKLSWSVCLLLKVRRERSCWLKGDVIPCSAACQAYLQLDADRLVVSQHRPAVVQESSQQYVINKSTHNDSLVFAGQSGADPHGHFVA